MANRASGEAGAAAPYAGVATAIVGGSSMVRESSV
jgi:hypothetical protein